MKEYDKRHIFHYILLVILLGLISMLILAFQFERILQLVFVVFFASAYTIWGLIHHHKAGDLHPKILTEYLLVSILGATILTLLLLRL